LLDFFCSLAGAFPVSKNDATTLAALQHFAMFGGDAHGPGDKLSEYIPELKWAERTPEIWHKHLDPILSETSKKSQHECRLDFVQRAREFKMFGPLPLHSCHFHS
jgi:FERM domain-containing protein